MKNSVLKSVIIVLLSITIIAAFAIAFSSCSKPNDGVLSYCLSDDESYYIVYDVVDNSIAEIIIPESYDNLPIKSIGGSAFLDCKNLANITIPDSVTSIGNSAFSGCISLASIVIPNSVTSVGYSAFSGCRNLTSIVIPDSVTSIGFSAFSGCSSLTSITIPDSVTNISDSMFSGCGLTSVTIGNSVTSIGSRAFSACNNLKSLTIGNNITSIGSYAFAGCNSLKSVYITDLAAWCNISFDYRFGVLNNSESSNPLEYADNLYLNGEFVKELVIPDGVTSIGSGAFYGYSSLASITIPDSVTNIGAYAFEGCKSLKSVYITDIAAWCNISFGNSSANPLSGADNLYLNGELVKELVIPSNVTSIGDYAFYITNNYYKGFTSMTIPDSVTSIGNYAFYKSIATNSDFTSIIIPDSVTNIGEDAFYGLTSINNVTIGSNVTSIATGAFGGCDWIKAVTFNGTVEQWNLIESDMKWYSYVSSFAIYCTDGTISMNGTVTYY